MTLVATNHSNGSLTGMVVEELLSFMPIGSFLALLSELYSTLNNICSWWNGGKRELRIVSVTSLLTQKAICSLYFSGSLHNTSVHQDFGVSRQLVINYMVIPFNLVDATGNWTIHPRWCFDSRIAYTKGRAATGGKTAHTEVLPWFCKIERSSGNALVRWLPLWWSCLPKICRGGTK